MKQLYRLRDEARALVASNPTSTDCAALLKDIETEIATEERLGWPGVGERVVFAPGDEPF